MVLPISNILDKAKPASKMVKNASWTLSILCRGRPAPNLSIIKRGIISLAKVLIENDDKDILLEVCWAFSHLSNGAEDYNAFIL